MYKLFLQFIEHIVVRFIIATALIALTIYVVLITCENLQLSSKQSIINNQNELFLTLVEQAMHRDVRDLLYDITSDHIGKRVFIPDEIAYLEWHEYQDLNSAKIVAADDWSVSPKIVADFAAISLSNQLTSNISYTCNYTCYILTFNTYVLNNKNGYAITALRMKSFLPIFMSMRHIPSLIIYRDNNDLGWLNDEITNQDFKDLVATNIENQAFDKLETIKTQLPEHATYKDLIELLREELDLGEPSYNQLKYRKHMLAYEITFIPNFSLYEIWNTALTQHTYLVGTLVLLLILLLLYVGHKYKKLANFLNTYHARIIKFIPDNVRTSRYASNTLTFVLNLLKESLDSNHEQDKQITRLNKKLSMYSNYDPTSGLPNQEWLIQQLIRLQAEYKIDGNQNLFLIQFSTTLPEDLFISEELCHDLTKNMNNFVSSKNYLANIKPNLYGLITTNILDVTSLYLFLNNFKKNLEEHFNNGTEINLYAGIVNILSSTISANQLLKKAHLAYQYSQTDEAENTFQLYNETMNRATEIDYTFETNLLTAKQKGDLALRYDYICDMTNKNTVVALKTTAYWVKETQNIPLDDYIEDVIKCGLACELSYWKIETAFHDLSEIDKQSDHNLDMYIPLDYAQLLDPNILSFLDVMTVKYHLLPSRIFFSITEESLSHDIIGCLGAINALQHNGYGVHLSSFNTGYLDTNFAINNHITSIAFSGSLTKRMLSSEYDRYMINEKFEKCLKLNSFRIICCGVDNTLLLKTLKASKISLIQGNLLPTGLKYNDVINQLKKETPILSEVN